MDGDKPYREDFITPSYPTKEAALDKAKAVINFHVVENGWKLLEQPEIIMNMDGSYSAKIKLEKPIEQTQTQSRKF